MVQPNLTTNPVNDFIFITKKKSVNYYKRFHKEIKTQSLYIAPPYRDFVNKVFSNNSIKLKPSCSQASLSPIDVDDDNQTSLSKRKRNIIHADMSNKEEFPHELGHAVDFWFGITSPLSAKVVIQNNKTLKDIFNEEFSNKHKELYQLVMNEYKSIISSNINENAFEILTSNIDKYKRLCNTPYRKKDIASILKRKMLQQELYDSGFVEVYYQLITKKCYAILNHKYGPILDALSSIYDFEGLNLFHHQNDYYERSENRPVQEFFANVFSAKITAKHAYFDNLIKYLPKSFDAFERLFVIFYDHIINNKRFTDLTIKQGD